MKKIIVAYWAGVIEGCKFKHMEEYVYTPRKQQAIVKYLLDKKLSVMLKPSDEILYIFIDTKRFGQR